MIGVFMGHTMKESVRMKLQKPCKEQRVITADARSMLCAVAGQRDWSDTRQSWLAKAARRLGWPYSRTSNIFYGRARLIRAEEWITLNEQFAALTKSARERQELLDDLSILSGAGAPVAGENTRPAGMEGGNAGQAGPWGKRGS